jgi:hypothetical protein
VKLPDHVMRPLLATGSAMATPLNALVPVTAKGEPGDVGTANLKVSRAMALGPLLLMRTVTETALG